MRTTCLQRTRSEASSPVDVIEDTGGTTLDADLPGVSRERLNVHIEGDTLSIEGDLALSVPEQMQPSHAEIRQARYRRSFTLSKELDASKIEADLNHGVLRLRIPKAEHARRRRIEIKAA